MDTATSPRGQRVNSMDQESSNPANYKSKIIYHNDAYMHHLASMSQTMVEGKAWIRNYIPLFYMNIINHPCPNH